ncbi:MAG: hypothetical protein F6K58_13020 [Symploca sp. SIO2E9]|nr:hypothetical protein [Symploca sp. SIO2E9]
MNFLPSRRKASWRRAVGGGKNPPLLQEAVASQLGLNPNAEYSLLPPAFCLLPSSKPDLQHQKLTHFL